MDFQAIFDNFRTTVTEHYFDMNGRVGRSQFWYFVLAYFVFAILASILSTVFLPLAGLYGLAMLLPSAGMGARRLQDIGRDGKLVWIFIVAAFVVQLSMVLTGFGALTMGWCMECHRGRSTPSNVLAGIEAKGYPHGEGQAAPQQCTTCHY